MSRCFRVGFGECRKSQDNYQFVRQVGSLQHAWEIAARKRLTCGSYHSSCITGEETRAHSSVEATWAFLTGIEQPLAESSTREEKRTAASRPYGTPQVDLRHMLEGDVAQDVDEMLFKVSENWGTQHYDKKGKHNIFNKGGIRCQGLAQLSRELAP